jgi:hypothetical protein
VALLFQFLDMIAKEGPQVGAQSMSAGQGD